jgi:hypothetical protein
MIYVIHWNIYVVFPTIDKNFIDNNIIYIPHGYHALYTPYLTTN